MNSDEGDRFDPYESSFGVLYGLAGVVLLVIGGMLLANLDEADMFGVGAIALFGSGLYLIVAGAVARGIQLARR